MKLSHNRKPRAVYAGTGVWGAAYSVMGMHYASGSYKRGTNFEFAPVMGYTSNKGTTYAVGGCAANGGTSRYGTSINISGFLASRIAT